MQRRGLLLRLHRAGEIELPARYSSNPFVRRVRPAPVLIDQTPHVGALKGVKPIAIRR
jgi:hypothetical protein